jgi:hypothetical protein
MDVTKGVRLLAASLMMLTGIIHLALAAFTDPVDYEWTPVVALFGLLYLAVGIGLLADKRISYYLGAIIPLVGACVAALHESYLVTLAQFLIDTYTYLRYTNPLVGIDIVVILCCCYLILRSRSPEPGK